MYIQRLLCPVGFCARSGTALYHAAAIADWYGAELHALHVMSQPASIVTTERAVNALVEASTLCGRVTKTTVAFGEPVARILEYIQTMGIDLVVMGRRMLDDVGVDHAAPHNTTDRVCDAAPCPIIVVPVSARNGFAPESARLTPLLSSFDLSPSIARGRTLAHALT